MFFASIVIFIFVFFFQFVSCVASPEALLAVPEFPWFFPRPCEDSRKNDWLGLLG
jgi:hypothetical protein